MHEVKDIINSVDRTLVSVRCWKEYIGEISGYNYITKKGRIPGSVFSNCGNDSYHMEYFYKPDRFFFEFLVVFSTLVTTHSSSFVNLGDLFIRS
jgi:3-mercaptopyruvate sulfurtransferase SseA